MFLGLSRTTRKTTTTTMMMKMTMMLRTLCLIGTCLILVAPTVSADMTISELASKLEDVEAATEEMTRRENTRSAFTATTKNALSVSVGKVVVFPYVSLSHGLKGYDPETGIYTVPASGLYQFQARVNLDCRNCAFIGYLKVNGVPLAGIAAHDKYYYDAMTTSALVHVLKGDQVYLENSKLESGAKIYQYTFSSFSGVLLEAH